MTKLESNQIKIFEIDPESLSNATIRMSQRGRKIIREGENMVASLFAVEYLLKLSPVKISWINTFHANK